MLRLCVYLFLNDFDKYKKDTLLLYIQLFEAPQRNLIKRIGP